MTGLTRTAIAAVRARFKGDADAVLKLRAAHKTVRPFGDGYSVNEVPVDSAELHRLADELQARQAAKARRAKQKTAAGTPPGEGAPRITQNAGESALATNSDAAPCGCVDVGLTSDVPPVITPPTEGVARASVTPAPEDGVGAGTPSKPRSPVPCPSDSTLAIEPVVPTRKDGRAGERGTTSLQKVQTTTSCRCARPKGHGGRCWVMRGMDGPTLKRRRAPTRTCACGGPLSHSARGDLCRKCHLATVRKDSGTAARIAALECEVDAKKLSDATLKAEIAGLKKELSAIRAQLDMGGR